MAVGVFQFLNDLPWNEPACASSPRAEATTVHSNIAAKAVQMPQISTHSAASISTSTVTFLSSSCPTTKSHPCPLPFATVE